MSPRKIFSFALALALPLVFAVPALVFSADKPAAASKAATYSVDANASAIHWTGKKVTGQHNGTVPVKSGDLLVAGGAVTGGTILIDTANLDDKDLSGAMHDKLVGHLKSDDFFGVAKYPTAKFEITSVTKLDKTGPNGETHQVSGNLTIKDKTNPLSFAAKITVADAAVTAVAKGVAVDRTLYDIRYGSGKFFQGLGDKVVYDQFWLDFDLAAKK